MIQHDLMHWLTLKGQKASGTVSDKIISLFSCSVVFALHEGHVSLWRQIWRQILAEFGFGLGIRLYDSVWIEYIWIRVQQKVWFAAGHEFFIQPTDFDIGFLDYVEDTSKTVVWSFSHERMVWVPKGQPHDTSWKMSVCQSLHDSFIGIYNADQNRSIQYMFSWKPGRPRRPHHLHRAPRAFRKLEHGWPWCADAIARHKHVLTSLSDILVLRCSISLVCGLLNYKR